MNTLKSFSENADDDDDDDARPKSRFVRKNKKIANQPFLLVLNGSESNQAIGSGGKESLKEKLRDSREEKKANSIVPMQKTKKSSFLFFRRGKPSSLPEIRSEKSIGKNPKKHQNQLKNASVLPKRPFSQKFIGFFQELKTPSERSQDSSKRKKSQIISEKIKLKHWHGDFAEKILLTVDENAQIGSEWNEESSSLLVSSLNSVYSKMRTFNHLQNDSYIRVSEKNSFEMLLIVSPEYPYHSLRRFFANARYGITRLCFAITNSAVFEAISMSVILINSIILAFQRYDAATPSYVETTDTYFLVIYTLEMLLKIAGQGFLMTKESYLRDYW